MHFPRFIYHDKLDPRIWEPDTSMNMLVQNSLMMIAWSYIAFLQQNGFPFADSDICDVIIHGSTSNYYYDDTSDIDLCIVANFEHLYSTFPPMNINLVLRSMLGTWKRNFTLRVAGRGVDITIVDVANPLYADGRYKIGGEYSLMHNKWIKQSVRLSDVELCEMRRVAKQKYRKYMKMYRHIMARRMGELYMETFLNKIDERRKNALVTNDIQPITAEAMAFRMLRQRGIIKKMRDMVRELRSKNFNI